MSRILVTGGAGFIGRRTVEYLVAHNYSVTVLDNLSRGNIDLIPNDIRNKVKWYIGDTRDRYLVDKLVSQVDAIIHLAAGSSFYLYETNPIDETVGTINGFLNLIEGMRSAGIKKIVYASTSAVYEGNPTPFHEDMPLNPPDLKSLSKWVNEEMAHLYSSRYNIKAIGFRPFNVYGDEEISKGPYANTVSLFIWAMLTGHRPIIWGDGTQTRDFIFVNDVAKALIMALEKDLETQEFNLGTGIETSLNKLVSIINKKMKTDLEPVYRPIPIRIYADHLWGNMAKTKEVLGFEADISLENGVERAINKARAYIHQNPGLGELQKFILNDTKKY